MSPAKRTRVAPAITAAIAQEMREDPSVCLWGEDVSIGVMSVTRGLADEFGVERVRDTPISEASFLGAAIGASMGGMRPIVEIMYGSFSYVAWDQIVNQAARVRYMSGGTTGAPFVLVIAMGAALSLGAQHSEAPYASLLQAAGLHVAFPSTPTQAYWLTRAAIRSDDPTVLIHHPGLDAARGTIDERELGLGDADVGPTGTDLTVVAVGMMASRARKIAADHSRSIEVVDICSLNPLDVDAILTSVRKTRRVLVVDEARGTCSVASEISALVGESLFGELDAPVKRVTSPDVPVPFSPVLEREIVPSEARIVDAIEEVLHA